MSVCLPVLRLAASHLGLFCTITSINIFCVCLPVCSAAPNLAHFCLPMSHKKDARFTWVIVHAMAILVPGISQQDNKAVVKNEKELNSF